MDESSDQLSAISSQQYRRKSLKRPEKESVTCSHCVLERGAPAPHCDARLALSKYHSAETPSFLEYRKTARFRLRNCAVPIRTFRMETS